MQARFKAISTDTSQGFNPDNLRHPTRRLERGPKFRTSRLCFVGMPGIRYEKPANTSFHKKILVSRWELFPCTTAQGRRRTRNGCWSVYICVCDLWQIVVYCRRRRSPLTPPIYAAAGDDDAGGKCGFIEIAGRYRSHQVITRLPTI